jgi:putative PIG3 family NAD(P)H quinone oxidoreductase
MRAVVMSAPGGPQVLSWGKVPDVRPGPGEVVVDVVATAVNRADLRQREGFYPPPPGASDILGLECSGRISAVGADVHGWAVGDEVCALLAGGGYAEQVAVPAVQLLPVPPGVSLLEAAALPEVCSTVWSTVFMLGRLAPGESILVHGGGSGIGTTAIQLAARHGARVFTTAGSAEKLERCRELGAEVLIDYHAEDFVERVREETGGRGVDMVLDHIGADYLSRNLDALAVGGRQVSIGIQSGNRAELNLGALLTKRLSIMGATLRARPPAEKGAIIDAVQANVWPRIAREEFRVVVDRVLDISDVAEAHRVVTASEHVGKVLLQVR